MNRKKSAKSHTNLVRVIKIAAFAFLPVVAILIESRFRLRGGRRSLSRRPSRFTCFSLFGPRQKLSKVIPKRRSRFYGVWREDVSNYTFSSNFRRVHRTPYVTVKRGQLTVNRTCRKTVRTFYVFQINRHPFHTRTGLRRSPIVGNRMSISISFRRSVAT